MHLNLCFIVKWFSTFPYKLPQTIIQTWVCTAIRSIYGHKTFLLFPCILYLYFKGWLNISRHSNTVSSFYYFYCPKTQPGKRTIKYYSGLQKYDQYWNEILEIRSSKYLFFDNSFTWRLKLTLCNLLRFSPSSVLDIVDNSNVFSMSCLYLVKVDNCFDTWKKNSNHLIAQCTVSKKKP